MTSQARMMSASSKVVSKAEMSFDSLHGVYLFAYPDEPLICNHIAVHQQFVCASADMALWLAVALPGSELPQRTTERIDGLRTGSFAGGFE